MIQYVTSGECEGLYKKSQNQSPPEATICMVVGISDTVKNPKKILSENQFIRDTSKIIQVDFNHVQ